MNNFEINKICTDNLGIREYLQHQKIIHSEVAYMADF